MQDTEPNHDAPQNGAELPTVARAASGIGPRRMLLVWASTLGAGILAGLVSWLAGESMIDLIRPPQTKIQARGGPRTMISRHARSVADGRNAAVAFAALGGVLGAGLGAAGGLARRSGRAAARAGLLGLAVGAAAAGGATMLILPSYNAYRERHPDEAIDDLLRPLLVHLGAWAPAGAAGGWAFAIGLAARGRTGAVVLGGLLGAAMGTVAYELIGAFFFPLAGTARLVSQTAGTRLLARMAIAVPATAGAVMGLTSTMSSRGESRR